jgi:hypothetical protein
MHPIGQLTSYFSIRYLLKKTSPPKVLRDILMAVKSCLLSLHLYNPCSRDLYLVGMKSNFVRDITTPFTKHILVSVEKWVLYPSAKPEVLSTSAQVPLWMHGNHGTLLQCTGWRRSTFPLNFHRTPWQGGQDFCFVLRRFWVWISTYRPSTRTLADIKSYPCKKPWRPIGLWDVEAPTSSRQSQMAVRFSGPRAGRPSPPGRFLVLISVRGWVDPRAIVRLEELGQLKNRMTSSGIEPATFWLVA